MPVTDPLAEFGGVKPKRLLKDEEVVEVGSKTSKSVYKVKRTMDHYYCTCPAWRMQARVRVESRTCKHIREILGDAYEDARIKAVSTEADEEDTESNAKVKGKNEKRKPKAKENDLVRNSSRSATKKSVKTRDVVKAEGVDEDEEEENSEESSTAVKKRPTRTSKGKKWVESGEEKGVEYDGDNKKDEGSNDSDPLSEINGVKPKQLLADEEVVEVRSKTSKSVYKVKRTLGHYYCTCPAWRMQARVRVEARTCKHIREVLGDAYEDARTKAAASVDKYQSKTVASTDNDKKGKGKAPVKVESVKRSRSAPKEKVENPVRKGEEVEGELDVKVEEGEKDGDSKSEDEENDKKMDVDTDALMFDGIKPNHVLADGESVTVDSHTSSSTYKVKRTFDHYSCSCPAWRNQARAPVNARTCKHLRQLLGDAYKNARIKYHNPDADLSAGTTGNKTTKSRGTKRKAADDDDDDGEDDVKNKRARPDEKSKPPDLLLAVKWDLESGMDPTGWWVSEKLDGVRVYYDGTKGTMVSRLGNPFTPPAWFIKGLPKDVTLDGELFGGRGAFQSTVSVVKTRNSPRWSEITFQVFDVPSMGKKPFEERIEYLKETFSRSDDSDVVETEVSLKHVVVVEQTQAMSRDHVMDLLKDVESKGGEGLMLRKPGSQYEGKRSSTLQKIKTFYDAEARVTGYAPGKGKHKNSTGALKCVMASGKTFNVGTGLSDSQRQNPPKIGSIIVYRFQELTPDGVPRFPAFVGEAIDKTEPKDAEIPEQRRAAAKSGKGDD